MPSPYSDLDRPPLSATGLSRALVRPGGLWTDVRVLAETGSTNADVAAAATRGEAEGLVVVAEAQTAGRGRLERVWRSPPRAGLTVSVLLRPPPPRERWGWLPLLSGLAVARAVENMAQLDTALKWPNDVLVGTRRRKLAGLLTEVSGDAVVVGVGLNVTTRPDELPGAEATSLAIEGVATDRMPLLVAVLRTLADGYRRWLGGADVREPYVTRCETLGQEVRVSYPDGRELTGRAVDIEATGRLVVEAPGGARTVVAAGDVSRVRPHSR